MSATQYIGARYVPVFADPAEWSSENSYEPLTIVLHNGNSYTSAQYVPVGIDIENDSYWKLTGNFNSQVEQYRSEVKTFDARITTADTTANDALSLAQTNEKDIAALDSEMAGTSDSGLKTLIENEVARANNAEKVNSDAIAAESSRASSAEKVNSDAIAAESSRAIASENEINNANAAIDIYVPSNTGGISNSSNIIITDKVGLIDCGNYMVEPTIAQMNELGFSKFDYVIFTHMHGDHVVRDSSALDKLKNFIDPNTPIYIQMEPNSSFAEYGDYELGLSCVNSLNGSVIVPTDNKSINIGNTTLTFYNTNESNIDEYSAYSELNIFSLVVKVQYANNTYVNCGDIYWTAQNKYTNIGNCNLLVWPHHCVNLWDSYKFINQFGCNHIYRNHAADGLSIYNLPRECYFVRWLNQNRHVTFYTNGVDANDKTAIFRIKNGCVSNIKNTNTYIINNLNSFYSYLDVDANTTDNINEYKNWTLTQIQNKMHNMPVGTTAFLKSWATDNSAQYSMDLYALILSNINLSVSDYNSIAISFTKYTHGGNVAFIYHLGGWLPYDIFILNNFDNKFTFPTYTSIEDVHTLYSPSNLYEDKKLTLIGELRAQNDNKYDGALPRIYSNGIISNMCAGSSYIGKQTFADFANNNIFDADPTSGFSRSIRLHFYKAIGDYAANTTLRLILAPGTGNYSFVYLSAGHLYSFGFNQNHGFIYRDSTLLWDSSTDSDSVSLISYW